MIVKEGEKRMKTKIAKFLCASAIAMLVLTVFPVFAGVPSEPHPANSMWVEPSTIDLTNGTSVGFKFNVTVWVNVTSVPSVNQVVGAWQYAVVYNKTQLNATRTGYTAGAKSQFFENITSYLPPGAPSRGTANATHNYIMHAESWLAGPKRVLGYGSLGWVEFEVIAVPPAGEVWTSYISPRTTGTPRCKILDDVAGEASFNGYPSLYIIPEFPLMLLPIFIVLSVIAIASARKLRKPTLTG